MLFPELQTDLERIVVRWILVSVGVTGDGEITVVEVIGKTLAGTTVISRTFWPVRGATQPAEPLSECLRFAEVLTGL